MIPILCFQGMHDYVWFIAPIDYCVELILVYETCENCSHFLLKWFQPNSFEEFRGELQKYAKNSNVENFRAPSIRHEGVCL